MAFWDDDNISDGWSTPDAVQPVVQPTAAQPADTQPGIINNAGGYTIGGWYGDTYGTTQSAGGGDEFDHGRAQRLAEAERRDQEQAAHTAKNVMSREDFLKKHGTTFVADDKGGTAASEVAGQDVAAYYDRWLDPKRTLVTEKPRDSDEVRIFDPSAPKENVSGWGTGHKYRDAHPYFDAWDNVNPHPVSQDLGGLGEAWRQIGRPVATAVAMYYGVGALAGAAGAGTAATAGAAATPASGLAGAVGMNAGMGATALNSGALNAGMSLARGNSVADSLRAGVVGAALSPVGAMASNSATSALGTTFSPAVTSAIGTVAGNTAIGGAGAALTGRDIGKGIINGAVNGVVGAAGNYVGGLVGSELDSKFAGNMANGATQAALRGGDPLQVLISGGIGAAASEITSSIDGFDEFDRETQQAINSSVAAILRGKNPTQALIEQAFSYAIGQIGSKRQTQKQSIHAGGW